MLIKVTFLPQLISFRITQVQVKYSKQILYDATTPTLDKHSSSSVSDNDNKIPSFKYYQHDQDKRTWTVSHAECLRLTFSLICPEICPLYIYNFTCLEANLTDPAHFLPARGRCATISFKHCEELHYMQWVSATHTVHTAHSLYLFIVIIYNHST